MTAITAPTTPITIATGATQIYSQLLLLHQQLPQNTYITTAAAATTTINVCVCGGGGEGGGRGAG